MDGHRVSNHRSDPAVKQILLAMNEKQSFIIEDLDEKHVVIKADEEWRVRRELESEVRSTCIPSPAESICFYLVTAREEYLQPRVMGCLRQACFTVALAIIGTTFCPASRLRSPLIISLSFTIQARCCGL